MLTMHSKVQDANPSKTSQTNLETAHGIGSSTDQTVSTAHTGVVKVATITDSVKFQRTIH